MHPCIPDTLHPSLLPLLLRLLGWLSSAPGVLAWFITEQPCGWSYCASFMWNIWDVVICQWPAKKLLNVPVFQQTLPCMLQLAQRYQAAAGSVLDDANVYGQMLHPAKSKYMVPKIGELASLLAHTQATVLKCVISSSHTMLPSTLQALNTLQKSPSLAITALQFLGVACGGMQAEFKAKAQQQQRQRKKRNKKRKQQQQHRDGTQDDLNLGLLELVVPADHAGMWFLDRQEGVSIASRDTFLYSMSTDAAICQVALLAMARNLEKASSAHGVPWGVGPLHWGEFSRMRSPVRCLGGMKLLLEAALLLQGVDPEAGVHYELQLLLNSVIWLSSRSDAQALLRERGELIMQAARVTEPEEWVRGTVIEGSEAMEEGEGRRGDCEGDEVMRLDWMDTLRTLAERVGERETSLRSVLRP